MLGFLLKAGLGFPSPFPMVKPESPFPMFPESTIGSGGSRCQLSPAQQWELGPAVSVPSAHSHSLQHVSRMSYFQLPPNLDG